MDRFFVPVSYMMHERMSAPSQANMTENGVSGMEIRRAKNTWRFDPVDQAYTLVTGNRSLGALGLSKLPGAPIDRAELTRRAAQALQGLGEKNAFLGTKGEGDTEWVASPSPTPLVFVEEDTVSSLPFSASGALGAHEILCAQNRDLDGLSLWDIASPQWEILLSLFRARSQDLARDVRLFASRLHIRPNAVCRFPLTHGQLLAFPAEIWRGPRDSNCAICEDLAMASEQGTVLTTSKRMVAYVPFAPRSSLHLRIACTQHQSLLSEEDADELIHESSLLLHQALRTLHTFLPQGSYQWSLGPVHLRPEETKTGGHLILDVELLADTDQLTGSGWGIRIANLSPQELASHLRSHANPA
jgi:hypothetical protein